MTFTTGDEVYFYYNPNDVIGVTQVTGSVVEGVNYKTLVQELNLNRFKITMPDTQGENLWQYTFKKGDTILATA